MIDSPLDEGLAKPLPSLFKKPLSAHCQSRVRIARRTFADPLVHRHTASGTHAANSCERRSADVTDPRWKKKKKRGAASRYLRIDRACVAMLKTHSRIAAAKSYIFIVALLNYGVC
ncbi:unnamed protein product [Lampetra planeri]